MTEKDKTGLWTIVDNLPRWGAAVLRPYTRGADAQSARRRGNVAKMPIARQQ